MDWSLSRSMPPRAAGNHSRSGSSRSRTTKLRPACSSGWARPIGQSWRLQAGGRWRFRTSRQNRPRLPGVFWTGRQNARRPFGRRQQGHSAQRHRRREEILAGLQEQETCREACRMTIISSSLSRTAAERRHTSTRLFEEDDPRVFLLALRNVAQARGMSKLAAKSSLNRESLYKM